MSHRNSTRRLALSAMAFAFGAATSLTGLTAPAHAAEITVTTAAELSAAAGVAANDVIILGNDITVTDNVLNIHINTKLDLAGHTLTTRTITISSNRTFRVSDSVGDGHLIATALPGTTRAGINTTNGTLWVQSGTITATGGTSGNNGGAGIGGNANARNGTTVIVDGIVNAQGGIRAAGIGGGSNGHGSFIGISGGTVTARGGERGAGIGSGHNGDTGTIAQTSVQIQGGDVTAQGGAFAAGIGGGSGSIGATVSVSAGTVTATGGDSGAGIGGGINGRGGTLMTFGGQIRATGGSLAAGIGSGYAGANSGGLVVYDGHITAVGGVGGAGIGGAQSANGGPVTVLDGTVIATGGTNAAGIGGGNLGGGGGTTTISGGTVTATGGAAAAGIGGGNGGNGGTLVIGDGAVVTAATAGPGIAVGPGLGNENAWSVQVAGMLRLPAGAAIYAGTNSSVEVLATGVIAGVGDADAGSIAGSIAGVRTVVNGGALTLPTEQITAPVSGNNFAVTFDGSETPAASSTVRVFAPTFDAGERSIPVLSAAGVPLVAWNTEADGAGDRFTAATVLTGDLTVYAQRTEVTLELTAASAAVAGDPLGLQVTASGEGATGDATGLVDFTSDEPSDTFAGVILHATVAGERMVTATLRDDSTVLGTLRVTVQPATPATLTVTADRAEVAAGGSIEVTAVAADAYGNPVPTAGSLLIGSSESTDVIDGTRVSFASPGARTITATLGTVQATLGVTVSAAPVVPASDSAGSKATALERTGTDLPTLIPGALALVAGAGMVIGSAVRRATRAA